MTETEDKETVKDKKVVKLKRWSDKNATSIAKTIQELLAGRKISLTVRQETGVLEIRADGHFVFGTKAAFSIDASRDTTVTCSKCTTTGEHLKVILPLLEAVNISIETLPEEMNKTDSEFSETIKNTQALMSEAKYQVGRVESGLKESEDVLNKAKKSFNDMSELRRKLLILRDKGNKLADMVKKE